MFKPNYSRYMRRVIVNGDGGKCYNAILLPMMMTTIIDHRRKYKNWKSFTRTNRFEITLQPIRSKSPATSIHIHFMIGFRLCFHGFVSKRERERESHRHRSFLIRAINYNSIRRHIQMNTRYYILCRRRQCLLGA